MHGHNKISAGQLAFTLLLCRFFTIMTFVPLIANGYELSVQITAAVISTLIQGAAVIPLLILGKSYPDRSVSEAAYMQNRIYGGIIAAVYMVYFIFYAAGSVMRFMRFVTVRFLPRDNSEIIIIVFMLICAYCAYCGIEGLARASVPAVLFFAVMLLVMAVSSTQNFTAENIYAAPVNSLYSAVSEDMLRNGEIVAAAYLIKNVKERFRCGIYGYLSAKLIFGVITAVLIAGVLGEYISHTDYPFLSVGAFGRADYIQRNDAVYLIIWTLSAVISVSVFVMLAGQLARELFPAIKGGGSLAAAALVMALALIFSLLEAENALNDILAVICGGYAAILLTAAIPILVLVTGRKRTPHNHV